MQQLIRNIMYDIEWQAIRIGLAGKWITRLGCVDNIKQLRTYLESDLNVTRAYRVLNTLNATRMGFNAMHLVGSEMDKELVMFRTEVRTIYQQRIAAGDQFIFTTEESIREGWQKMSSDKRTAILADLQRRLYRHQASLEREDLRWAIKIMLDEQEKYVAERFNKALRNDSHDK